jgi:hypothetical protein
VPHSSVRPISRTLSPVAGHHAHFWSTRRLPDPLRVPEIVQESGVLDKRVSRKPSAHSHDGLVVAIRPCLPETDTDGKEGLVAPTVTRRSQIRDSVIVIARGILPAVWDFVLVQDHRALLLTGRYLLPTKDPLPRSASILRS